MLRGWSRWGGGGRWEKACRAGGAARYMRSRSLQSGCHSEVYEGESLQSGWGSEGANACRVLMVTMGGDLQPGSLADRLLTGLGQPQINP